MNPASSAHQRSQVPQNQQQFRNKQRKRDVVDKYEPEQFRDDLFNIIPDDEEQICSALEANEVKLDLKRYAEPFFEIFIVGGLIAPGGVVVVKDVFSLSIFECDGSVSAIKSRVDILNKLARRLKYIPKKLEETCAHLLTYINKYGENTSKLAVACGLFGANGLISLGVLDQCLKDHLVDDGNRILMIGTSLEFLTTVLQTYLKEQNIDHLTLSLRKANLDWKLLHFFPPNDRSTENLVSHFNSNGLKPLADYYMRQQKQGIKDLVADSIKEMISDGKPGNEVAQFLKEKAKENSWSEQEAVCMLWTAIMKSGDWTARGDQIEGFAIKLVTAWCPTLAVFCNSAKSELALMLHVQLFCYDDSRFLKHFRPMVQHLYKGDVLSESAIFYWFEKGASPQGKSVFLAQMEAFVKWLREQESSDEDE